MKEKVRRPALRYHGGKWKLAPWIIQHFPPHRVYCEPFGGAASVLIRKERSYAEIYNDLDGEIVNLFRVLRDHGEALQKVLSFTPFARQEFEESYESAPDPIEQARRTVVRSFMGFGSNSLFRKSGFRSNSNRSGTTPAHDWSAYPEALPALIQRLQGVVIEQRDALSIIPTHDSGDTLFYVDPPYVRNTRDAGDDYCFEMDDDRHLELVERLNDLRGMVVVSGYNCSLYNDLFAGWKRFDTPSFADGARARTESLWLNREAIERQPSPTLL